MSAPAPTPESALIATLAACAPLAALLGSLPGGTPAVFIEGGQTAAPYPYIAIQRISTPGASELSGKRRLEWPRMQVDIWAQSASAASQVAEAVRQCLDGVTRTLSGFTFATSFQDQRGPAPDPETENFRAILDYYLTHQRS